MAVTSNWEWIAINRDNDLNVSGGVQATKSNWSLVRKRISNEAFSGQIGESATSLTATNGSRQETVTAQYVSGLGFDANTAWTNTTSVWVPNGYKGHSDVYVCSNEANIPNSTKKNIIFQVNVFGSTNFFWACLEADAAAVSSGSFFTGAWATYSGGGGLFPQSSNYITTGSAAVSTSPNGKSFVSNAGTFTGDATATVGNIQIPFKCTSDVQTFENGLDWYTQTQIWVYKSSWSY